MIMALVAIPVVGMVAGAVDYSMASRARSAMQSSLDAALLAAGRQEGDIAAKKAVADDFLKVELGELNVSNKLLKLRTTSSGRGLVGDMSATYKPYILPVLGIKTIDIAVTSEVVAGTDARLDVALVLDNTASLGADGLGALQNAALSFQQTIYTSVGSPSRVQMGVVPFAGAVNVGRDFSRQFLDTEAVAPEHARRMENLWIGQVDPVECKPVYGPSNDPGEGGIEQTFLQLPVWMQGLGTGAAYAFGEVVGVKPAAAGEAQDHGLPPGYGVTGITHTGCRHIVTPPVINNFDLLNGLNNIDWGGCVEARSDGFDTTDSPASAGTPASLFVPYFWPDELDVIDDNTPFYTNNYTTDESSPGTPPWTPADWAAWDGWGRTLSPTKYVDRTAVLMPGGQFVSGPNRGCPQPLTPLTSNASTVESAIKNMQLVDAGGTIVSEGAAWGWRVLSPAAPFMQTSKAPNTKRIMVIMSDGENQFSRNPREPRVPGGQDYRNSPTVSDYNAYGYLRGSRFGDDTTFDSAQAEVDRRTLEICTNAKDDGIEVYTVLFKSTDGRAVDTLKSCATSPNYHFFLASSSDQLNATFENIAASIGRYRLVK